MAQSPQEPPAPRLRRNLLVLFAGEALAKGLGMGAFLLLATRLLEARFGDLEYALGVLFVLNLLLEAGLAPYGAREASREPGRTLGLAARIAGVRIVLLGLAWVVMGALVWSHPGDSLAKLVTALYALVLLPVPLALNWAFQARGEMGLVAGASVLRQAALFGGVLLFVHEPADAWLPPLFDAVGYLAGMLWQQLAFRRRVGKPVWRSAFDGQRAMLGETWPFALSTLCWALRLFFPLIALRWFASAEATGHFAVGHRWVIAAHTFVWLYFVNLLPTLSRFARDGGGSGVSAGESWAPARALLERSLALAGWLVLPGCLVALALVPWLTHDALYGARYEPALAPLGVLLWMLAVAFFSGHFRYALFAWGRQRQECLASACGAVLSIGSALWVGRELDPASAAWIVVAAESTTFLVARLFLVRRVGPLPLVTALWRPLLVMGPVAFLVWSFLPPIPLLRAGTLGAAALAGGILWQRELFLESFLPGRAASPERR